MKVLVLCKVRGVEVTVRASGVRASLGYSMASTWLAERRWVSRINNLINQIQSNMPKVLLGNQRENGRQVR